MIRSILVEGSNRQESDGGKMWRITKIVGGIDWLNQRVCTAVFWLSGLTVVVVAVDVVMRYLFRISHVFIQELEWHLFGVLFLPGAGYILLHDAHVRVDIFYQRLTARQQASL